MKMGKSQAEIHLSYMGKEAELKSQHNYCAVQYQCFLEEVSPLLFFENGVHK